MIFKTLFVKLGVEGVEILFVEPVGENSKILAEALIMHDLAFSEEAYSVLYVGIVTEPQNVVVGRPRLLLWGAV